MVLSVLIESLILALVGRIVGGGLAYLVFDGFRAATPNWQSFSQVALAFNVTPGLLVQGIAYAALIGLVGGLLPPSKPPASRWPGHSESCSGHPRGPSAWQVFL